MTNASAASARGSDHSAHRVHALEAELAARDAVLSAMSEGVLLFDRHGRLAFANRAARSLLGRRFDSAEEASPRPLREGILDVLRKLDEAGVSEQQSWQFETAGTVVDATALPDPAGDVVVVLRDVATALGVERLRRDFVANASHELKTPVASILTLSDALAAATENAPDGVSRWVAGLQSEAQRLAALVADLLDLSRLEGGTPKMTDVVLTRIVTAEVERLRPRAESAGLRLKVKAHGRHTVRGSAADLALLVHNLVDNAIRYTPDGGAVHVSLERDHHSEVLAVADTGIGIPEAEFERVFERFYRVDSGRSRQTGGTGLGLSIVRHVADLHGGQVKVGSVLGSGSVFTVRLPKR